MIDDAAVIMTAQFLLYSPSSISSLNEGEFKLILDNIVLFNALKNLLQVFTFMI